MIDSHVIEAPVYLIKQMTDEELYRFHKILSDLSSYTFHIAMDRVEGEKRKN
jgi:hypothetical protein